MQKIQDRFGIEYFSFVDDSVKNLKDLDLEFNKEKKRLSLLLATWGYTGPEEAWIARGSGYSVLKQLVLILLMGNIA
jgi:hypothetical protein